MNKYLKCTASAAVTAAMLAGQTAGVGIMGVSAKEETSVSFNPETVMWTNNKIENVLAEAGIYKNAAEVNPNADKNRGDLQNPYAKQGEKMENWAYSEFLWTNSYPIGNGRMAGMIAGGIDKEVIQINEDTAWDGSPYGTLKNEKGETITTMKQAKEAQTITAENPTSGSVSEGWRYFRGADENDNPAQIGSADAMVGDEAFRSEYPEFANKSISNQALSISNEKAQEAVQNRWYLEKMVEAKFLGSPQRQRAYKSFAEVYLDFNHQSGKASNYVKSLDMEKGIVTVEYDYDGHHFKRESFASYPDQTVVTHVESDAELAFSAELHTYHNDKPEFYSYEKISDNEIKLAASITNGNKDNSEPGTVNAIQFEARMLLRGEGAFSVSEDNKTVSVKGGKTADIYVVGATNYVDYLNLDNTKPARECGRYMENVKSREYETIKARHVEDFSAEFKKSSIHLDNINDADYSGTPTEKRVREDINGKSGFLYGADSRLDSANKSGVYSTYSKGDNELISLNFNYGKYLILSGAREGRKESDGEIAIPESQPLNLTGKWNAALSASWNGKYTININTEMNYWAAQPLNVGESEKTLIDTFADLAKSGAITAANQYGVYNERGDDTYQAGDPWVMHHNYDLWRGTQPIDNATAGLWPTGGVWLLDHAWQYYLFNEDEEYLAEVYPYMTGAAKFFTQFLVPDPETGYLITSASCSPEQGGVQPGPAMDTQLVRNLYDTVIKASEILGKADENKALLDKINEQMPSGYFADEAGKLAPDLIDNDGYIKEWVRGDVSFDLSKDNNPTALKYQNIQNPWAKKDEEKEVSIKEHDANNHGGHRHCSHLWELYPGTHLSAYDADTADLFDAFKKTTTAKGAGDRSWAYAWRAALNARALDGNKASASLEALLTARTSPNMFTQHPNFQIDGNYGETAAIAEMLLQSHDGAIDLLPALPDKWQSGHYTGLKARGGAIVDCAWSDGKAETAEIRPSKDGKISVRAKGIENAVVKDSNGSEVVSLYSAETKSLAFDGEAGKEYIVNMSDEAHDKISMTYSNGLVKIKGTGNQDAVLIQTAYDENGAPVSVKIYPVKLINGTTLEKVENIPSSKVMLWKAVDGEGTMEPLCAVQTAGEYQEVPAITDPPKTSPTPSAEPTDPPELGNTWVCSEADSTKKTGDYVMNGLSLLFDVSSSGKTNQTIDGKSFNYYISSGDNGTWSSGAAVGTALKYVAPSDGTFNVYIVDLGAGKELCITKEGVSNNKENTADSAYYRAEVKEQKKLSLEVKAGETYYTYVAGSKGRFAGAELIATGGGEITPSTPKPTAIPSTPRPLGTPLPTLEPIGNETKGKAYIGETEYESVNAALADITAPQSEAERVYIDLASGVYREQVVVSKPYITIRKKAGAEGEAKITWYYGLGSLYDSCNESGYYDASVIGDGKSNRPADWGAALKIDKNAHDFTAEGIVLENSYNRYYTQEEITDLTSVDDDTHNSYFERIKWITDQKTAGKSDDEINAVLQTRTEIKDSNYTANPSGAFHSPRERSAALHSSADRVQFINCQVISTQDTIGINSGRVYFENCRLGGTTDYICGSSDAVFHNCELLTNAGKDGESATITAPSNGVGTEGYLFYNCHITGTDGAKEGDLGRPWGSAPGPAAAYINTVIDHSKLEQGKLLVKPAGWTDMSDNKASDARFAEYGSVDETGKAVDVSNKLRQSKILNEWSMLRYNPFTFTKGSDNWDPAGIADKYTDVNRVIDETAIDTSDGTTNEIALPNAPEGYEYSWESNSEYAEVSADKTKIMLIRPAYGEQSIDATVKLYARKADDKEIGAEKSIPFKIEPTTDNENVFAVSGTVSMLKASDTAQNITLTIKKGSAVMKSQTVTVPAGETSASYTIENVPAGEYIIYPSAENKEYNIDTAEQTISGEKGSTVTYDVSVKKMVTITVTKEDFDEFTPTVTSADGFSAGAYTASSADTANLTEGNKVYKLTKDENKTVAKNTGVSFDLKGLLQDGTTLLNTKTIRFSYDFLMEKTDYFPSDYSYFDLAASTANGGNDTADDTRFIRWGVHKGWGQINMFGASRDRINGDNTQFDKNNTMKNRWYRITADIDLVNQTVTTTLCDRDKDMEILNKKPFEISKPAEDGTNPRYPSKADLNNLYFNIYMDKSANTTNKIEYYVDNISLTYMDYE